MRHSLKPLFILLALIWLPASAVADDDKIVWQPWSASIFAQAKRDHKLVLLDLEAVWCHWCHVMEEKTYGNRDIIKQMNAHYIAVKVDQDANPDISLRYEDYGWPATVVFAADGSEIVKRRGYIRPEAMTVLLDAIVKDPSPGPSVLSAQAKLVNASASTTQFSATQRDKILSDFDRGYDEANGGWGEVHKFILAPNMEYALERARLGDRKFAKQARQTLDAALNLVDPVWGGMYQYSDKVDWKSPHFEKIMSIQTDNIRLYSQAYLVFNEPRYLKAAQDIQRYLADFLTSPEGAFYSSQNADQSKEVDGHAYYPLADKERRALGMPRIDTNVYARENGWVIRALAALYEASSDEKVLQHAKRSLAWVEQNRSLPDGGFRHAANDPAGPYLGDTLAMGEAYLALYVATGDRQYLSKGQAASKFIAANFESKAGFATATIGKTSQGVFQQPVRQMEENVGVARLANVLLHYTGDKSYQPVAEHAVKYLVALARDENDRYLAGPLLAVDEYAAEPAHITIIGAKTDAVAQALHAAAIKFPASYRRIEWWDKIEGALPNPDVQYPDLGKAAAFICVNHACSTPIFEPEKISQKAAILLGQADQ